MPVGVVVRLECRVCLRGRLKDKKPGICAGIKCRKEREHTVTRKLVKDTVIQQYDLAERTSQAQEELGE